MERQHEKKFLKDEPQVNLNFYSQKSTLKARKMTHTILLKKEEIKRLKLALSRMTKPELEKILQNANFTQDEESVFWLLARGKAITEISQLENVSERTVNRKIKDIRLKVSRLE